MRKILLLAVLIAGYYLTTFSQVMGQLQIDTTFKNFTFKNNTTGLLHFPSVDINGQLFSPKNGMNFLYPKFGDKKNLAFGRKQIMHVILPNSMDNMRCLKPQGFFPMPICKPDSTVNYTLLIKKF